MLPLFKDCLRTLSRYSGRGQGEGLSRIVRSPFGTLAAGIGELFYPSRCAICDATCESRDGLCSTCNDQLMALAGAACDRCALPLSQVGAPCPWCKGKGRYPFTRFARLGVFEDPLKTLIHHMKYHRRWAVAEMLAERLLKCDSIKQVLADADCLLPVPLHFRRQFARGYNQAHVLAKRIGRGCGIPVVRSAIRIRNTKTQTEIRSQKDRHENVRDAFTLVNPREIEGKNVVVVDDVMTSGATLQAVGRALLPAKPASLSGIVVAVADPRGRHFEMI